MLTLFLLFTTLSQASFHCDLYRDSLDIPHIKSESAESVYACMGYAHAIDRLWQMDHLRRIFQGRRAEVYGFSFLKEDFRFRLLGLEEQAERIVKELSENSRKILSAYVAGVNQGAKKAIQTGVYEFKELGIDFEPWTEADTVGIFLLQSLDQTRKTFETEFTELTRLKKYGENARALTSNEGLPWSTTILKPGEYQNPSQAHTSTTTDINLPTPELQNFFATLNNPMETGSNNWVVAPQKSITGKAWLANDPHLSLQTPSLWHWSHLESKDFDVIGVTVPGLPLISSGTGKTLAWGLTNSYVDVGDVAYIAENELKNLKKDRPWIWIKFLGMKLPFFFKTFERTEDGFPILPLDAPDGHKLVLKWVGFKLKGQDLDPIFTLLETKTAQEMDQKLSHVGLSSWNFVFADTTGKIGYRAVGTFPKRKSEPVYGIQKRSYEEFKKWGMLSPSESPAVFNPSRGFIATANHRQWPEGKGFPIGRSHTSSFRGFRIEELLTQKSHSRESLEKTQCDVQAVDARFILPKLLSVFLKSSPQMEFDPAIVLLKNWNYTVDLNCKACAIYRTWVYEISQETLLNDAGIYRSLESPDYSFFKLVETTFNSATDKLKKIDPEFPAWSKVHQAHFRHSSKQTKWDPLNPISTPGDQNTVSPGSFDIVDGKPEHTDGASMRTLIELKSPPEIHAAFPAKNSDRANYDLSAPRSPWNNWRDCKYEKLKYPLDWKSLSKLQTESLSF